MASRTLQFGERAAQAFIFQLPATIGRGLLVMVAPETCCAEQLDPVRLAEMQDLA